MSGDIFLTVKRNKKQLLQKQHMAQQKFISRTSKHLLAPGTTKYNGYSIVGE